MTRSHTTGSVLTSMRKLVRAYIAKRISTSKVEVLVKDIVSKSMQRDLQKQLHHMHPTSACEIRQFEIISEAKSKDIGLKIVLPPENLPDYAKKIVKKEPVAQAA